MSRPDHIEEDGTVRLLALAQLLSYSILLLSSATGCGTAFHSRADSTSLLLCSQRSLDRTLSASFFAGGAGLGNAEPLGTADDPANPPSNRSVLLSA